MTRKSVPRIPDENPPPYKCVECWFFETMHPEHGACYALPPAVAYDEDGDLTCPRAIVLAEDRGCIHWKSRHGTQ